MEKEVVEEEEEPSPLASTPPQSPPNEPNDDGSTSPPETIVPSAESSPRLDMMEDRFVYRRGGHGVVHRARCLDRVHLHRPDLGSGRQRLLGRTGVRHPLQHYMCRLVQNLPVAHTHVTRRLVLVLHYMGRRHLAKYRLLAIDADLDQQVLQKDV